MTPGSSRFDDEEAREPDQGTTPPETDGGADDPPAAPARRRTPPNYLIRRAVVIGGVVAVLATASIVVGQLIGSGSNDSSSGAISTEWNRIVLVDDRTGRVVVDDVDGNELSRIESGVRSPTASAIVGSTLVIAGADQVGVVDVDDEGVEEYEFDAETIVQPAGSALTMIAPRTDGGRGLLVHGPSGDTIDTDTFAPVVGARYEFADARSSTSGRHVLLTDSGNFQSVLFSFDREEPSFFPGLALAVGSDLVVTAQNVGRDATVSVFDHDGEPITTGRTPSVRAGMIIDSGIVLVTVDGGVVTMSTSNGEIAEATQLDIGTIESGDVATTGDRLVIVGALGTAIVDADAAVVASVDDQRPTGTGQPQTGSTCLTTVTMGDVPDPQIAVIDLTDGAVLVEAAGSEPLLTDASGCIAGTSTSDGYDVMSADTVQQFQTGDELLALALDGRSVVAERGSRVILLDTETEDPAPEDPVDLGPRGRTVHFTQS